MTFAVGYIRLSDKDQSNNSIQDQQVRITEYCHRNNIALDRVFIENGKSAFTFQRPEWRKLEAYITSNKKIAYIVVKDIDRFSRATLMDALIKIHEIEEKLGRKILTIDDTVDADRTDLGFQLLRTMKLIMSNNERNQIQKRVKDGLYRSLANGRFCNMAPFGYLNSKDDTGRPLIIPDPGTAQQVKEIFKLYNQGMNIADIQKKVKIRVKGNSAIQRILSNSIYAGIVQVPAYRGKPALEVQGIHKPLISKADYYKAVSRLGLKKAVQQPKEDVWLRGVIHCTCGRKMTAGNSKGRNQYYWYYKCPDHLINYRADKMHGLFYDILKNISLSKDTMNFIREALLESIEKDQRNRGGVVMNYKLRLEKLKNKLKEVQTRFLLSPDIDTEVYSKVVNDLKQQESELEAELYRTTANHRKTQNILDELLPLLESIADVFEAFPLHQKHLFINTIFSIPLCFDGEVYRTARIHRMFADKAMVLKEKRLLILDNNLPKQEPFPGCTRDGS